MKSQRVFFMEKRLLMVFTEIILIYCENNMKLIQASFFGENSELLTY